MRFLLLLALSLPLPVFAQSGPWQIEPSETTADLRGVHAAGNGVVWASGTSGTVLRSQDSGFEWQQCATPPGAEKLDFRAVWAWSDQDAVVMSSGTGDQSRLYKTTDGCAHWTLLYTNPDKAGFWDGLSGGDRTETHLTILGDPTGGNFTLLRTVDGGSHWSRVTAPGLAADPATMGAFAASNSSLVRAAQVLNSEDEGNFIYWFATGGTAGPFVYRGQSECDPKTYHKDPAHCSLHWKVLRDQVPLASGTSASGGFSLKVLDGDETLHAAIAVGGNYEKPEERHGTAACWSATTNHWEAASVPPGGYRSAVDILDGTLTVEEPDHATWITVGPNGSDISRDNGRTWQPIEHAPADLGKGGEWNALSLPWAVGPHGRIGKLNAEALPKSSATAPR